MLKKQNKPKGGDYMALWLIVNDDMYYQGIEQGESMEDIAERINLKWATLIVRLDDETVETIKKMADEQS